MLYHALHRATMDSLYTKDWKNKDLWEKYTAWSCGLCYVQMFNSKSNLNALSESQF